MRGFKDGLQGGGQVKLDRHHEAQSWGGEDCRRCRKRAVARLDSGSTGEKGLACGAHMLVTGEREGVAVQNMQLQGEDAFAPRHQWRAG
jgi:hypothetical protein